MVLEKGDLFVVTRGYEIQEVPPQNSDSWLLMASTKTRYDQTFRHFVFEALEVCESYVAAKVVISFYRSSYSVGSTISLNFDGLEVMTVTKAYVDALKTDPEQR